MCRVLKDARLAQMSTNQERLLELHTRLATFRQRPASALAAVADANRDLKLRTTPKCSRHMFYNEAGMEPQGCKNLVAPLLMATARFGRMKAAAHAVM